MARLIRQIEPPTARELVKLGAYLQRKKAHERFTDEIVPALLRQSAIYGLDAVGVVIQSAKETGFGKFGGKAPPNFHNTCGLKWRYASGDEPLDHARFGSWDAGAQAHCVHLVRYTMNEKDIDPPGHLIDPRYYLVPVGRFIRYWSDLGGHGKWAPSETYGDEIEKMTTEAVGG